MPPPAPRPSKPSDGRSKTKNKGAPKNDRPKTMPQANRDKCGACSQDHDIRYCPYPNTEDGRVKICPICNTSHHAWFECWYYKRDVMEQWTVCWVNRRCLPALVHDAPLDGVFHSRVSLSRETTNKDGPSPVENLNRLPGPLSPAFVKKLMPLDLEDAHIQHELQEGRIVPWELRKEMLEDNEGRTERVVRDEATMDMRIDRFIDGTRSSVGSVPAASKQEFFHGMDKTIEPNNDVYNQILANRPLPSLEAIKKDKGDKPITGDRMRVFPCGNCGTRGHKILECPTTCKACGDSMRHHLNSLIDGKCKQGCLCRDDPGHKRIDCVRLCRPCVIEDRGSQTQLKDCKKHCPFHACLISDGRDHSRCVINHTACPSCNGRHWHQDCPQFLESLCVHQDCLAIHCDVHCIVCGGPKIDEIMSFFPNNDNAAYRKQVQGLVRTWHKFLHDSQWERIPNPGADIKHSFWSVLNCKRHRNVTAVARIFDQRRVDMWKEVVDRVQGGFTKETVAKAERLLQVSECWACS